MIAQKYASQNPTRQVVVETSSAIRHPHLRAFLPKNVHLQLREERAGIMGMESRRASSATDFSASGRHVVICLPPSVPRYLEEVEEACQLVSKYDEAGWAGPRPSSLLLISSIGVYDAGALTAPSSQHQQGNSGAPSKDGKCVVINELSPTAARGLDRRRDQMLAAEDIVRGRGGRVLRLAGNTRPDPVRPSLRSCAVVCLHAASLT